MTEIEEVSRWPRRFGIQKPGPKGWSLWLTGETALGRPEGRLLPFTEEVQLREWRPGVMVSIGGRPVVRVSSGPYRSRHLFLSEAVQLGPCVQLRNVHVPAWFKTGMTVHFMHLQAIDPWMPNHPAYYSLRSIKGIQACPGLIGAAECRLEVVTGPEGLLPPFDLPEGTRVLRVTERAWVQNSLYGGWSPSPPSPAQSSPSLTPALP